MKEKRPRIFLIGETNIVRDGLNGYLEHIGAKEWGSDASTDPELICEVMGRSCYRSFGVGLNKNITKVREGNEAHLQNIIRVKHGSVLEHSTLNFMFCDVSRVFTHELVRHRAGVAVSQESLRFVRLDDLGFWPPLVIRENKEAMEIASIAFSGAENLYGELERILIKPDMTFGQKKIVTSALRRIAPIGLSTNIGWSANFRTIRHVLEQRTDPSAEEEIKLVFGMVGAIVTSRYKAIFGDYEVEIVDKYPCYKTENKKI